MKTKELEKLLNAVAKKSAITHHWKYSGGFIFKQTELLFFAISIVPVLKQRNLYTSLYYKWLGFDDLFWKIVRLEENSNKPLSFRARGVFTAPMTTALHHDLAIDDWTVDHLQLAVEEILSLCEAEVEGITREVIGLDENLEKIERLFASHMRIYPNSVLTIWCERLLTCILKNDYAAAQAIIQGCKDRHELGRFIVRGQTFYELADDYLQSIKR